MTLTIFFFSKILDSSGVKVEDVPEVNLTPYFHCVTLTSFLPANYSLSNLYCTLAHFCNCYLTLYVTVLGEKTQVMFWKYLLNVVCLPDESFIRYTSALFLLWLSEQTCCWFSWLKPKAWLCGGAWSPFLSVCVVRPYLCTDRHEDMRKLKCAAQCFLESCFAVVTVACKRFFTK